MFGGNSRPQSTTSSKAPLASSDKHNVMPGRPKVGEGKVPFQVGSKGIQQKRVESRGMKRTTEVQRPLPKKGQQVVLPRQEVQRPLHEKVWEMPKEADIPMKLTECPMGCGRSFNREALIKHQKICKKVFQSKRRQFNSMKQREIEAQIKPLKTMRPKKEKEVMPKKQQPLWKLQSQAFRNMLKQDRLVKQGKPVPQEVMAAQSKGMGADLCKCQFCGRSFSKQAGERHIPFCEKKAKESSIRKGGKR